MFAALYDCIVIFCNCFVDIQFTQDIDCFNRVPQNIARIGQMYPERLLLPSPQPLQLLVSSSSSASTISVENSLLIQSVAGDTFIPSQPPVPSAENLSSLIKNSDKNSCSFVQIENFDADEKLRIMNITYDKNILDGPRTFFRQGGLLAEVSSINESLETQEIKLNQVLDLDTNEVRDKKPSEYSNKLRRVGRV
jgi:hypothetical protein